MAGSVATSERVQTFVKMLSAFFKIVSLSSVISPMILIAKPGPGNGCLAAIDSSKPNLLATFLTSSLCQSAFVSTINPFLRASLTATTSL